MRRTKRILQWLVGIAVGIYLAALLLVNIPVVQRWLASGVASLLENTLETKVEIGRVVLDWNGRVIVDDLQVWDRQQQEMLRVARVGARLSVHDLIHQRIRIGNAQLFGLHANLYQECEGCDPNFKFIIDAFASKDTTKHTPLDLRISQLLVRRGSITWRKLYLLENEKNPSTFNPSCIDISDLNVTAQLNCLTDDSLNVRVKRLDFTEQHSGLVLTALAFHLEGNRHEAHLSDFRAELPGSKVEIPSFVSHNDDYLGSLKAHLSPADFTFIAPKLGELKNELDISAHLNGHRDNLHITSLQIQDDKGDLRLNASGSIFNFRQGKEQLVAEANIRNLFVDSQLFRPYFDNPLLNRLGDLALQGKASYANENISANLQAQTPLGNAEINGTGSTSGNINATVGSDGFLIGELLDKKDLGLVALSVTAKGTINKQSDLTVNGRIAEFDYKGYRYRNIELDQFKLQDSKCTFNLATSDPNASLKTEGDVDLKNRIYKVKADIASFAPHTLNLTSKYVGTHFSGQVFTDLKGDKIENLSGIFHLNDFLMTDSTGTYRPGDVHLTARPDEDGQHLLLISPFLEAQVSGKFEPKVLVSQVKRMVSNYLPSATVTSHPGEKNTETAKTMSPIESQKGTLAFIVRAYSTEPLRRLLGIPLHLTGTLTAHGEMDSEQNALWLNVKAPGIEYGNEHLRNIDFHLESNYESLLANLGLQRQMKGRWIALGLDTKGFDGKLATRLSFDNKVSGETKPESDYSGDVNIISRLWMDMEGKQGFEGQVLESNFTISDTLWTVHPGSLTFYDGTLQVDSFQLSQGKRFIRVDGRASKSEADTLHTQLQRINLEYIFSLINFHAVELTGEATGDAYAHSLFSSPKADAYIRIPQFALNYGTMGDLDIHVNWGDRPYSIYLDGKIEENGGEWSGSKTLVKGYITPKKDIDYHGIDLNVKAERVNLEFINKWTEVIFDDLQGRATGWVHIFGPFKQINIEGDALVNEASVGIPFIGVRYHLQNDSVQLRPDNIYFTNAHIYDPQGNPGVPGHSALVSGRLHHDSFKNLSYDINIHGDNILGYDFHEFGDQNFYGTVYANGDVSLKGHPGMVRIGIKAAPLRGTTFTYNATSPDKLTETPFITYVKSGAWRAESEEDASSIHHSPSTTYQETPASDLYIDFDLDIDEQSTMNLLMDARSGDKITLNGSGHMLAHFYNKGSFDLFGTYRVNRGTYNLSLQEVIHKNFDFSPDGTISFNGEPYGADLNLQAIHTVSGVSLNDINPKANFSNASTRVNCLMNIGGKASSPRITFDFDIPNANEEEKQMVRSLISTEEERNMQVVYLLGIGRFYAYDYANENQTQGTMAMNSLLSSTLSGTINQAISNMLGNSNWNFGANLRTGEMGWSDMDVEGMLQGNLLNNRLLINGNFGYRDTPVANSNFIGDFDVKYLLTRSGSVALKAYSETNDRYFTKSTLTTQGIGVILKKDFTSWKDLVVKRKKKNQVKQQ